MRLKKLPLFGLLILLCFISIIVLLGINSSNGISRQKDKETLSLVRVIGLYSLDGQEAKELTEDTRIDSNTLHTVTVFGHFSSDIPKDRILVLLLDNIRASISVNDREVYNSEHEEYVPAYSKTPGNTWGFYISPGITKKDNIKIVLQNVYSGTATNVFDEFLSNMSFGHGFELYHTLIIEKLPSIIFGFIIFTVGIIVFILCFVAALLKAAGMGRGMALACLTIIGGCWISINGGYPYVSLLFNNPLLFNTVDELQIFLIPVALVVFTFTCLVSANTKKIAGIISGVLVILLTCAVLLQITGRYDLYEMQGWAVAIGSFAVLVSVVLLSYEALVKKHRQTLLILLSWLPLFFSGLLEALNFYIHFMAIRTAMQYGFALSILLQLIQLVLIIRGNVNRIQKASRLEYELLQSRMAVMLSQIQPHFLFNTLNDIRFLYRESPSQAEKVLISFTRYLRGNMDSLNQVKPVPFEQELSHLKNYTDIEKIRFGNRLNIIFEIGCTNFSLPVLTIQPLVENAIRHGITPKRGGGTVTIRTFMEPNDFVIEVCDDGVGFATSGREEDVKNAGGADSADAGHAVSGRNEDVKKMDNTDICRVGFTTSGWEADVKNAGGADNTGARYDLSGMKEEIRKTDGSGIPDAGFDPSDREEDGRTHTGIKNVRMRLKSMCGGSLTITSCIGEGTISLVRIPKEKKNENTYSG